MLGLPKTLRKYDSILVIVDRFSKMVYFLPCSRTVDASRVAKIYFDGVVKCMVCLRSLCLIEM